MSARAPIASPTATGFEGDEAAAHGDAAPVLGVYTGGLRSLPREGQRTGIFKTARNGPVQVGLEGLDGDLQADRRVHGGPEKAVHHYPAEHFEALATAFPTHSDAFQPGSIGENLSTRGWTEDTVHVGDLFRAGSVLLEVSQPRMPCWKIDHRYGVDGVARLIRERQIAGWYYRVREPGTVQAGDGFSLVERCAHGVSLAELWHGLSLHRPSPDRLERLRALRGLAADWQRRLQTRIDWLRRHLSGPGS